MGLVFFFLTDGKSFAGDFIRRYCGLSVSLALVSPAMSSAFSYLGSVIDIVFPVMGNRTGNLVVLFHLV